MKLTIPAADLKKTLKKLGAVKAEKTILDTVEGRVAATDNELSIIVRNPALKAADPAAGRVSTFASKTLSALVSSLSGELTLNFESSKLIISSGKGRFELATLANPPLNIPTPTSQKTVVPLKGFSSILSFAASASEEKQNFDFSGSVQLTSLAASSQKQEATLRAAGTNHHRLAVADSDIVANLNLLIPVRAIHAIRELDAEEIQISENASVLFFEPVASSQQPAAATIVAKKLAKDFPQYEPMRNFQPVLKVTAGAEELRAALERVAPLIDDEHNRIVLTFKGDTLELSTGAGAAGKARDEVAIEAIIPDPLFEEIQEFRIAANHRYLSDFFNFVEGKITIATKDPRSPLSLTSGNFELMVAPLAL